MKKFEFIPTIDEPRPSFIKPGDHVRSVSGRWSGRAENAAWVKGDSYIVPYEAVFGPANNLQSLLEQLKAHPKEELEAAGITLAEPKTAREVLTELFVEANEKAQYPERVRSISFGLNGWGEVLDHLADNLHKIPGFQGVGK